PMDVIGGINIQALVRIGAQIGRRTERLAVNDVVSTIDLAIAVEVTLALEARARVAKLRGQLVIGVARGVSDHEKVIEVVAGQTTFATGLQDAEIPQVLV